jgi:hypothetical protein
VPVTTILVQANHQILQRIPLSDHSIDTLRREIIEIKNIIGDFKMSIDIQYY